MKITKLRIRNFRSIKSLDLDLDDTTVFIGPNNAGKTAILDCVRIALSRRWGQRGTGFTEYDVHSPGPDGDPRTLPSVSIEIILEEPMPGTWPDDLVAALEDIMAIGTTKKNQIALRIGCAWSADNEAFEPSWEFLDAAGVPLTGKSQRATNLSGFFGYLPLFWLGALRDAADEFSPRSQHWGRLLRSVRIPDELEAEVKAALERDPETNCVASKEWFSEMEEERRNCFVAITRTREQLVLSRADTYRDWRKEPSRFLKEMGFIENDPKPSQ